MDCILSIILGVLSSIVATVLWIFISSYYVVGAKKRITYLIEYTISSMRLLETSLSYNHYEIALQQSDIVRQTLFEIDKNIGKWNYRPKKRKLLKTYIFHSIRTLDFFKTVDIGYEGEQELQARCEKLKRKYFCKVENGYDEESPTLVILQLIDELNKTKNISDAFCKNINTQFMNTEDKIGLYSNIVDCNSFREKQNISYYMRNQGLSQDEYKMIINKAFKINGTK